MDSDLEGSEGESSRPRYAGPVAHLTEIMVRRMRAFPKPQFVKYQAKGLVDSKLLLEMSPFLADLLRLQPNASFKQSTMVEAILAACETMGMGDTWFRERVEEVEWAAVMAQRVRHACRHLSQALLKPGRKPYWAQQVMQAADSVSKAAGGGSGAASSAGQVSAVPEGPGMAPITPLPGREVRMDVLEISDENSIPAAQDSPVDDEEETQGQDVASSPGGPDVGSIPQGQDVVSNPGGQDVGSIHPGGPDVGSIPPRGQDVASIPGGHDDASSPQGQDDASSPRGPDVGDQDVGSIPLGGQDVAPNPEGQDVAGVGGQEFASNPEGQDVAGNQECNLEPKKDGLADPHPLRSPKTFGKVATERSVALALSLSLCLSISYCL